MPNRLSEFLVVTDVDGTLLRAGQPTPERNLKAVKDFREAGGNFTICTGRGLHAARKVIEEFGIDIPSIHCNGTLIYNFSTGEIIKQVFIDPVAREWARIFLKEFPTMGMEYVVGHEIWTSRLNPQIQDHIDKFCTAFTMMPLEDAPDGRDKLLFADEPEVIDRAFAFAEEIMRKDPRFDTLDFTRSSPIYFELIPQGINKGAALLELADSMGISYNNTVAAGDFYNDLPLLDTAAITAVVAGAPDDLKAKATYVVSECMEGGVADLLYLLIDQYAD